MIHSPLPNFILTAQSEGAQSGTLDVWALCLDVSGFTAMTEQLMQRGHTGAEDVSDTLNALFGPLVTEVYAEQGYIPYFAGDAFTALFTLESMSARTLLYLALRMRARVSTLSGEYTFDVKIGLSCGPIFWGLVGLADQEMAYFRGVAIDQSAAAQVNAQKGQILASDSFRLAMGGIGARWRKQGEGFSKLVFPSTPGSSEFITAKNLPKRGEFRQVTTVFIAFEGMEAYEMMNLVVSEVMEKAAQYGGYFKEIDFGDKGSLLVCLFGAPISLEDSPVRAIEFCLAIKENFQLRRRSLPALHFKMGLSSGPAFTGLIGGEARFQYAAVSKRVNLAARLVAKAQWGEILTDEQLSRHRNFKFRSEGQISYKGVAEQIATWRLEGLNTEEALIYEGLMVGRSPQLNELVDRAKDSFSQRKLQSTIILGEAGLGKSRITYALENVLKAGSTLRWCTCQNDKILPRPFLSFAYFVRYFFEQSIDQSLEENKNSFYKCFEILVSFFQEIQANETQMQRLLLLQPALENLCGLPVADATWAILEAKARYELTQTAIVHILGLSAAVEPVVIELEDATWIDSASVETLQRIRQQWAAAPIFIVANVRPDSSGQVPSSIFEALGAETPVMQLAPLELTETAMLASDRLAAPVASAVAEALQKASAGNPFYAEQLLAYWQEEVLIENRQGAWQLSDKPLKLSDSLQTVLTARLDRLSVMVQETIKAAAVIGREFEAPVLYEVLMRQGQSVTMSQTLQQQLAKAEEAQIWRSLNEIRYIFQQALLHEAVYDMQLRSKLKSLHGAVAQAIEMLYAAQLEPHFDKLALHYERAEIADKALEYLLLSAHSARKDYQNELALERYNQALKNYLLPEDPRRQQVWIYMANIYELLGQWDEAAEYYADAAHFEPNLATPKYTHRAINGCGFIALLQGDYETARTFLNQAAALFEQANDDFGCFKVYAHLGTLFFRQGQYEEALSYFERSLEQGKPYRHTATAAETAAYLGLTHMNLGHYDRAHSIMNEQMQFCEAAGNRQGRASLHTNLGIVLSDLGNDVAAETHFEAGLSLAEALGDKRLQSIALGCLGQLHTQQGNFEAAEKLLLADLKLCKEMGDPQGIAICRSLSANLAARKGELDVALTLFKKALKACKTLGYAKGVAKTRCELAELHLLRNKPEKAYQQYQKAILACRTLNQRPILLQGLIEAMLCLLEMGLPHKAQLLLDEVLELNRDLHRPALQFKINLAQAWLQAALQISAQPLQSLIAANIFQTADIAWACFRVLRDAPSQAVAVAAQQKAYAERPFYDYLRRVE